jgi:hypothetical protein
MLGHLRRSGSRQLVAALLIFALMLQGMAVAVAVGSMAFNASGQDPDWPGLVICHHDGSVDAAANDSNAALPGQAPEGSGAHCIFCLAGAAHALEALLPGAAFHVIIQAIASWPFTEWRLPPVTVDASARPRGPPPVA